MAGNARGHIVLSLDPVQHALQLHMRRINIVPVVYHSITLPKRRVPLCR